MKRRLLHLRYLLPLLSSAFLTACHDPVALTGCDTPHGCEVAGTDLAILAATVLWEGDQPLREEVGGHVVDPGDDLRLRFTLVNRGDSATDAGHLIVRQWIRHVFNVREDTFSVPALEPGEEMRPVFEVAAMPERAMTTATVEVEAFLCDLEHGLFACWSDADAANDQVDLGQYHLRVPYYAVSISTLPDTMRALQSYPVSLTVTNLSPFVSSTGVRVGFCLFNAFAAGQSCNEEYPGFGVIDVPAITAGGSVVAAAMITIPGEALLFVDRARSFEEAITPCLIDAGLPASAINDDASTDCGIPEPGIVLPDIDAMCAPPTLVVPGTLSRATAGALCVHHDDEHVIAAIDVLAGDRIGLTRTGVGSFKVVDSVLEWLDPVEQPSASERVFEFSTAGRYHVILSGTDEGATILVESMN